MFTPSLIVLNSNANKVKQTIFLKTQNNNQHGTKSKDNLYQD